MSIRARIVYVDGTEIEVPAEDWARARSDGVDVVFAGVDGAWTSYQGHSLYWLRREGESWVVGGASFYENPISEIIIAPDGTQTERKLEWVPDLRHAEVKLGWWWIGG